jgi:hypothetical protein
MGSTITTNVIEDKTLAQTQTMAAFLIFVAALLPVFLGCTTVDPLQVFRADQTFQMQIWKPDKAWNGTTVLSQSFGRDGPMNSRIVEINMRGEVVWGYDTGARLQISSVQVLPNNNILFAISSDEGKERRRERHGKFADQGGAYEVDRKGKIVWKYVDDRVSHDAVRLTNGNTLITAAHSEDLSPWPYKDPQVFEIDSQGKMVWSFYFKDIYANDSKYRDIRGNDWGPWTHTNDAVRLPSGNTLISARNFNLVLEVSKDRRVVKTYGEDCLNCVSEEIGPKARSQGGKIRSPHSPVLLSNGRLLVNEPGIGRVIEYDPASKKIVWQFGEKIRGARSSESRQRLFVRGSQRLPNGNTLVVDSQGQLIEVTAENEIVWKIRSTFFEPQGRMFFRAVRRGENALGPDGAN